MIYTSIPFLITVNIALLLSGLSIWLWFRLQDSHEKTDTQEKKLVPLNEELLQAKDEIKKINSTQITANKELTKLHNENKYLTEESHLSEDLVKRLEEKIKSFSMDLNQTQIDLDRSEKEVQTLRSEARDVVGKNTDYVKQINQLKFDYKALSYCADNPETTVAEVADSDQSKSVDTSDVDQLTTESDGEQQGSPPSIIHLFRAADIDGRKLQLEKLTGQLTGQQSLIYELRIELLEKQQDEDPERTQLLNQIQQLERLLQEFELCVQMLNDELDNYKQSDLGNSSENKSGEGDDAEQVDKLRQELSSTKEIFAQAQENFARHEKIVPFLNTSFDCRNIDMLNKQLLNVVHQLGLTASIQIRCFQDVSEVSNTGKIGAHERNLLASGATNKPESTVKQGELVLHTPKVSLIAKSMATQNQATMKSIQSVLTILCNVVAVVCGQIESNNELDNQTLLLNEIIQKVTYMVTDTRQEFEAMSAQSLGMMDTLTSVIDNKTFTSKMVPEHRALFSNILKETRERFVVLHCNNEDLEKSFTDIFSLLNH